MANRNKRNLNLAKNNALRAGKNYLIVEVPVKNYHSCTESHPFYSVEHPIHRMNKDTGIVSINENRNTCMRVIKNPGDSSVWHESLDNNKPRIHKNHHYIETYRQDQKFGGKVI